MHLLRLASECYCTNSESAVLVFCQLVSPDNAGIDQAVNPNKRKTVSFISAGHVPNQSVQPQDILDLKKKEPEKAKPLENLAARG
jgi:hypothetical protein